MPLPQNSRKSLLVKEMASESWQLQNFVVFPVQKLDGRLHPSYS